MQYLGYTYTKKQYSLLTCNSKLAVSPIFYPAILILKDTDFLSIYRLLRQSELAPLQVADVLQNCKYQNYLGFAVLSAKVKELLCCATPISCPQMVV